MTLSATPATTDIGRRRLVPAGSDAHQRARLAASLCQAAQDAGVALSHSYAAELATDGMRRCDQIGVTRLGNGVVIHTAPDSLAELPVVLGYADRDGEWRRDGSHHIAGEANL